MRLTLVTHAGHFATTFLEGGRLGDVDAALGGSDSTRRNDKCEELISKNNQ